MSQEEVAALHANFTRAREMQAAPMGTVLTVGACRMRCELASGKEEARDSPQHQSRLGEAAGQWGAEFAVDDDNSIAPSILCRC
jgi:hypothetical protein